MSSHRTAIRRMFLVALALTLPIVASASTFDVKALIDTDNSRGTGCTMITPGGIVTGIDVVLTTAGTVTGTTGTVTAVTRQTCSGGSLGLPTAVDSGGWNVGVSPSGDLFIESHFGLDLITMDTIRTPRFVFTASSGTFSDVILTPYSWGGGDIVMFHAARDRAVASTSPRTITLDGNSSDWAGVVPLGNGTQTVPAWRFISASAYAGAHDLFFAFAIHTNPAAPTAIDDHYALGTLGGTLTVATLGVQNNDIANFQPITSVKTDNPQHGSVTLAGDGGFTYVHDGSLANQDQFHYVLNGTTLQSNIATVTIDLPGSRTYAFTSANNTTFVAGQFNSFEVTVTGKPTPALTEEGNLPAGVSFTDNGNGTGTLSGTPGPNTSGSYDIVFHADKNKPHHISQNFTLTVVCPGITVTNPLVTTGTAGTAFSQTFTQSGGQLPVTFVLKSGTLPAGLTLSSSGVLSGTPTQSGTFPITVKVTDNAGCMAVGPTYNLVINCHTVTVTNPGTSTGTANAAFSQTFTQSGAISGATFSLNSGTLPSGLALNASSGVLSGTPTQTGSFPITVKVTDGQGCSGVGPTYNLVINCQTITVTNPATNTGTANAAFSQTFTASNTIGATTFTLNSGTLPTGLTLSSAGVLSGTPTQTGSFPITVKATDANGCFGVGPTYTLTIACQTITVTNPATSSGTVNAAFSQTFTASNTIGATTFTINSGTLPAGLTLSSAGVLSGTPTQTGSFPITVKATDANGCFGVGPTYTLTIACQTITVTKPVTNTGTVNVAFSQTFTSSNTIGTVNYTTASSLPSGILLSTAGVLSGTPTQTGNFPIVVTATDANSCSGNSSTYSLTINCQAITVNNPGTTTGQTGVAFNQTFTSSNTIGSVTYSTASTLPNGLVLASNGNLSGTPTQAGSFPIVVTVTDGNNCPGTGATYNLVINQPPAITSANSATFKVGQSGTFTVTTTGFPTNASMVISETGALPAGVTFVNNNDGTATLAGTPNAGTGGTYPITITANNGIAPNATQNFTLTVNESPAISSANNVTFKVGQAGTFTVTTTGFPSAVALSKTGALPLNVTFTDNGNGTATIAGTPAAATGGTYPLVITGNNGVTPNATQNFTLTVQQAPAITSANNVTFTVGAAGTFSVTTTGFPSGAAMVITKSGALPSGVTFVDNNDGTATLAGTPAAATGGTYPIVIGADNGVTPAASQNFTLTINQAPAITSANAATFTVGSLGTFTVTTTGFPSGASMVLSKSGALPGGVTFVDNNNGTATLSGTANALTGGTYPIVISANNGVAPNATQNFTLTVNEAPQITSANQATFPPGTPTSFTVTTTGFPTGAAMVISETGDPLPGSVTFVNNNDGTATISGTATGSGDVNIVITANNGIAPNATQNFTIHRNQAPQITSANTTTFTVGAAGTFTVTTTGFPTNVALSETGSLPLNVTFTDNGDGTATIAGTPNAGTGGNYPITITGNNGVAPNATQNFTLVVNQPPAITSANNVTFTVGAAGTFTVTTSGFPTAVALSKSGALPANVTFTDNGNGTATLAGTPAAATGGTYPIVITGNNGVAPNATQNFTLTVNQPPAITSANTTTFTVGAAGTFTVTTTGFPTNVALSKTGSLPLSVTFTDNGDGTATIAGTPNAGTGGSYPITITGNNGVAPNATQNFTLVVNQPPAITSGASTTFKVGSAGTFSVTTTGFPTNASMVISQTGSLPSGVTFVNNNNGTATLAGTPDPGTGGTYPIVITANNGVAPNATQNFTLTVQQAPSITSTNTATFTVGASGTFTVTTTGFPTAVALSKTGTLPLNVTFTDNGNGTATIAGTPNAGTGGTYPITITGNNGVTPNATQNFTLVVNQPPAITSAASTTFKVGSAGTFSVTTSGFPTNASMVISQTGTLPGGVTFVNNNNGTATLAGTPDPGTGGTYPIVITANNGVAPNATQNFTLTVQQAPSITSSNAATFTTGSLGTFTVTTTGFPTAVALSKTGSLPASVSFTDNGNGTATISGTPGPTDGGSYPLVITGNNGVTPNATQNFTLTINQPPQITSANNTTFAPGQAGQTFTVNTTGFPINGISRTGTLPSGVTFTDNGNNTATIAGTPAAGTQAASPYAWVITANNGVAPNATQNFTFNVVCPTITVARTGGGSFPAATFNVAYGTGQSVTASGSGATPYTYQVTSGALPSGLTLSTGGVISNTAPTATGTFTFTITATDAGGCTGSQSFSIAVNPVAGTDAYGTVNALVDNTQAYVTGGATSTPSTPAVPLSGVITANDFPTGGVNPAGTYTTTQGGSVTVQSDGTFLYTPAVHAAAITSDSFTYTGTSDTGGTGTPTSATGTVNLTLAGRVWYVKNNGGGSTGKSNSPFTTLAAAAGASTANDIIFVYNGDGSNTGQNAGITLKSGQQLLGEINGLTVNTFALVAAGSRPTIGNSGGDGVSVPATAGSLTGVFIKGLSIAGTANGINISSSGANTLTATVDNVVITAATANNGIKVAGGSSGTSTVTVQNSVVNGAGQSGIDAQQTVAGSLVLTINSNSVTATGTGININGAGSTSTTINGFLSNTVSGNTGGSGIVVATATFDATTGGTLNSVDGGNTVVGASGNGVGGTAMSLTNVTGFLNFTGGLSLFGASGLSVTGTGIWNDAGTSGFWLNATAGTRVVDATAGAAVVFNTLSGNVQFTTINSAGSATNGVSLTTFSNSTNPGQNSTFTAGSGSTITNATGTDFNMSGGNANTVTYDGTIVDTTGRVVAIASTTGGTKTFSGAITNNGASATGISLTSNTGATINFSGTITLNTSTNDAFTATGGGTVTSTSTASTITTTSGKAVNIANTTIGGGGVKFLSINVNGAANGIVLTSTGAGPFTVIGDGTAANNGSGGTIQATTGDAIVMTDVGTISLNQVNITNPGLTGIKVIPVGWTFSPSNSSTTNGSTSFTMNRCNFTDNAGAVTDEGLRIANSGAITLTNNSFTAARRNGIAIDNFSFNISSLTITGNTVTGSLNGDGILIETRGTAVMTSGIVGGAGALANTVTNNSATGIQVSVADSARIGSSSNGVIAAPAASNSITVQGNTISNNNAGIDMDKSQTSNFTFQVLSNTLSYHTSQTINAFSGAGAAFGGTITGYINGNQIGVAGTKDSGSTSNGTGIRVVRQGGSTQGFFTIDGNTIREVPNAGNGIISLFSQNGAAASGTGNTRFKVTNNVLPTPTGTNLSLGCGAGVPCLDSGIFLLADEGDDACALITGNNIFAVSSYPGGTYDVYLAARVGPPAGSAITVQTGVNGGNSAAALAFINANNTLAGTRTSTDESGLSTTVASCGSFPP